MNTLEKIRNHSFDNKMKYPYKDNIEGFRKYREEDERLKEEFKQSILEEFHLEYHPKSRKCFDMAWEDSHSSGLEQIYYKFIELSDLLSR